MTSTIENVDAAIYALDVVRERRAQRMRDGHLLRHLPLAAGLARRYTGAFGTEQELVKVANRGLVRAVEQFDPASGLPFATFAEPLIVAELEDHVQAAGSVPAPSPEGRRDDTEQTVAEAVARQAHVRDLAGILGCEVDALVDGLMIAIEREPHLVPSPAAREQPWAVAR